MSGCTVVTVIDVAAESVSGFHAYEEHMPSLLARHAGTLDQRLRTPDRTTEVHILCFLLEAAYRSYLGDPERMEHRSRLNDVEPKQRVLESLTDVS